MTTSESFLAADVSLRMHGNRDWVHSCEGVLVGYDPAIVTDKVMSELKGLGPVCFSALIWMAGHWSSASTDAPLNVFGIQSPSARKQTARKIARLVELGWQRSICAIPIGVDMNGIDLQLRSSGLTAEERQVQQTKGREKLGKTSALKPRISYLTVTGTSLAITWDWILGFTPSDARKRFGKQITGTVPCPAGDYMLRAWQFEDKEDPHTAGFIPQWVVQLLTISNESMPAW